MEKKKLISLNEDDLIKVEQIVIDRDKEEALNFVREVIKKQIDRENASKMKRQGL
jgi:transcription initiation factor IIF auxiliary subunit